MQPTPEHLMKGLERRAQKGFQGYPLAIIAFYGYNDKSASKAVIGIVNEAGSPPEHINKWVSEKGDLRKDVSSIKEMFRYIESHNVQSVAIAPGIYYCPHEPGIDYPQGGACPLCSFWSNVKKPDLFNTVKAVPNLNSADLSGIHSKDRPRRILELLIEGARNKTTLVYGDVMQAMELTYQDTVHRQIFKNDVREAVRESELYSHGLLISALLVFRIQHIPEDDFFLMAQELGMFTPGKDSKISFFKDHIESIYQYYEGK
jgi:hypothetical protein